MKAMTLETPVLKVEGLTKRYGSKEVVRDVSFTLSQGEIKVLMGPSGGGKSTLLQCINFLVIPDEGRIWLEGKEILHSEKKDLYAYRQKVGMIFQDFNLFDHLTALRNVEIALLKVRGMAKSDARERALRELERVGLKDHTKKYPAQLSGGQKQRVSIARALAMDPKVMLLDEPTSALDPELITEVLSVIRALGADGMPMILATHQIEFASDLADEIIFMEDGAVVESGPAARILSQAECARTREFCSKLTGLYGESR
jgi:polar amino acid transport system ATP-binding protein